MNLKRIVPEASFVGRYMQTMSDVETSEVYDFWCAMWVLGSVLGRGVYVPRPHAPVYMNWYIMLVAESGVTRKSTAVRMARDIVSHVLGVDKMIEGKSTPEYIFQHLTRHSHCPIAVSELVTFLGRESYIIDLPALLTDLYDCPKEKRGGTVTKGEQVIRDAFVTFISASTPSWLRTSVNQTVVEGGFTSRCLFVHDERPKKKVAWPSEDVTSVIQLSSLLRDTVEAAQDVRKIEMLPSGMKRFETWYKQRDTSSVVPFVASFNSREDAHVLRMAACLAVNDGTLAISKAHVNNAIKLISAVKAGAVNVFNDTGNTLKIAQGIDRIVQKLVEAGPIGISHTQLYAAVRYYTHSQEFNIVMTMMHELGMIVKLLENRDGGGRKGVRYARARNLTNSNAMQELMQTFV